MGLVEEEWKIDRWYAEYIKTRKNAQTSSFWDGMLFHLDLENSREKRYSSAVKERPKGYLGEITVVLER
jgi:hypothetical protein